MTEDTKRWRFVVEGEYDSWPICESGHIERQLRDLFNSTVTLSRVEVVEVAVEACTLSTRELRRRSRRRGRRA